MDHIFGPVNSRRLGRSLGVDLFTRKICNLNCIYCEVGPTDILTCKRAEYIPTERILAEIDQYASKPRRLEEIDVVTVTASGEPTLHLGMGEILAHLKRATGKPVVVLTNGTTLDDPRVRKELDLADIVIPSLDAARESSFRKVDRPARCLDLQTIIEGLVVFSHECQKALWLEILLVAGMNDSDEDVTALQNVVARMRLDRIQLNTVARPPLEEFARPVPRQRLHAIAKRLQNMNPGVSVELLATGAPTENGRETGKRLLTGSELAQEIRELLKRRPCTAADINKIFHCGSCEEVTRYLERFVRQGDLVQREHEGRKYYLLSGSGNDQPFIKQGGSDGKHESGTTI